MKIKDLSYESIAFEDFADKHDLVLEIRERPSHMKFPRYYAKFINAEISDRGCLVSSYGDGNTKEEAITAYASELLGQKLIIHAMYPDRKEIQCPNEWAR